MWGPQTIAKLANIATMDKRFFLRRFFEIQKGTAWYVAEADVVCFAVSRRPHRLLVQAVVDFEA